MYDGYWSDDKPTDKGLYVWRGGTAMIGLVLVHKRPTTHAVGGVLKGSIISGGPAFFDGCNIESWDGQWIGPLPP